MRTGPREGVPGVRLLLPQSPVGFKWQTCGRSRSPTIPSAAATHLTGNRGMRAKGDREQKKALCAPLDAGAAEGWRNRGLPPGWKSRYHLTHAGLRTPPWLAGTCLSRLALSPAVLTCARPLFPQSSISNPPVDSVTIGGICCGPRHGSCRLRFASYPHIRCPPSPRLPVWLPRQLWHCLCKVHFSAFRLMLFRKGQAVTPIRAATL
jgi:hypothetical protein